MISTNLQAKYALEDFEHSKASKRRKWVERILLCVLAFAYAPAIAWVMS
jgi:hypothetical protein